MNNNKYTLIVDINTKQGKKYSFSTKYDSEREAVDKKLQHRFTLEGNPNSPFYDNDFFITEWFMIRKSEISSIEFEIIQGG